MVVALLKFNNNFIFKKFWINQHLNLQHCDIRNTGANICRNHVKNKVPNAKISLELRLRNGLPNLFCFSCYWFQNNISNAFATEYLETNVSSAFNF